MLIANILKDKHLIYLNTKKLFCNNLATNLLVTYGYASDVIV